MEVWVLVVLGVVGYLLGGCLIARLLKPAFERVLGWGTDWDYLPLPPAGLVAILWPFFVMIVVLTVCYRVLDWLAGGY